MIDENLITKKKTEFISRENRGENLEFMLLYLA